MIISIDVTFTKNAYCEDCTYTNKTTCETNGEDWDEASNDTATLTGNTFVIVASEEEGCDYGTHDNKEDCETAGANWDEAYCEEITYTKE